jgi:hypothetical protein
MIPEKMRRQYAPPKMKKLKTEHARMLLLWHTTRGTEGARDLLELFYADPPEQPFKAAMLNEK